MVGPAKSEETLRKVQVQAKTGYRRETNTAGRAERSQWKGSRKTLRRSREAALIHASFSAGLVNLYSHEYLEEKTSKRQRSTMC